MSAQLSFPGVSSTIFNGLPALRIDSPLSTCTISLFGAHVLSFVSKACGELLWMSPTSKRPPDPIRGGVPLCWPHFAKQGQPETAPQHGTARRIEWQVAHAQAAADGEIALTLIPADPHQYDVRLSLDVRVGAALTMTLVTENVTATPFTFTQAFHTYFHVSDATQITVEGLDGARYLSKFDDFAEFAQHGTFRLEAATGLRSDRIYQKVDGRYALIDPTLKRTIHLTSEGSRTLVVWNPGADWVKTFDDIPHNAWRDYICLEVANAGEDVVTLAPSETKRLSQTIRATRT